MDLCVGTPVDELKGHCAGYAKKEEINHSYSDEQVHLCICRTVETLTGRSNVYQRDCTKMNG